MRLLVITIAPLFPDHVQGGSQRVLMQLLPELGKRCSEVRVLCSRAQGKGLRFKVADNVEVRAELPLRGAFPSPFEVAPHPLAVVWREIDESATWADRVYLHGDGMFLRGALADRRVVRSLHDFIYEEALVSAFQFPARRTIVPSQYVKECLEATVGAVRHLEPVTLIRNGIDVPSKRPPPQLPKGLRPRAANDRILLFPHRLDPRKGLREAMLTVQRLKQLAPGINFRLLIPVPGAEQRADDEAGAAAVLRAARELGVGPNVETHTWLNTDEMPGYYAAGDATLCLGSIVEAMPLAPLESVATGTPAVCSRTGPWRELSRIPLITHVPYGDTNAAADTALRAMATDAAEREAGRSVLAREFSTERMVGEYMDAVLGDLPPPPPTGLRQPVGRSTAYRLAPWCHIDGGEVFSHHNAKKTGLPANLMSLLREHGDRTVEARLIHATGLDDRGISAMVEDGLLVPGFTGVA